MTVRVSCGDNKYYNFLIPGGQQGLIRRIDGASPKEAADKLRMLLGSDKVPWAIHVDVNGKQIGLKYEW
jgi:hypothetical protein